MLRIDLTGQAFGRLVVTAPDGPPRKRHQYWACVCSCGRTCSIPTNKLRSGHTQSCGCRQRDGWLKVVTKHGLFVEYTREYKAWSGMIQRTSNPKNPRYPLYGGRGIRVCERWKRSFEAFFEDMGPRPTPKHKLDRIDNNGNYQPDNCRWATQSQQMRNTRVNRHLTFEGQTMTLVEWAERTGITEKALGFRLARGWSIERALTQPMRQPPGRRQGDEHKEASGVLFP